MLYRFLIVTWSFGRSYCSNFSKGMHFYTEVSEDNWIIDALKNTQIQHTHILPYVIVQ